MHARWPACAACLYVQATRKSWRNKGRRDWAGATQASSPGQLVSIDQLSSPTPGLVAQIKGKLTKSRYTCATIYVDQFSGFSYIYLQKSTSAAETFLGVNTHHTNGLAEMRISTLQDLTRIMLVDTHQKWGTTATASLWPYAMLMANDSLNQTPNTKDSLKRTPLQTFTGSEVQTNHWAPFGCSEDIPCMDAT